MPAPSPFCKVSRGAWEHRSPGMSLPTRKTPQLPPHTQQRPRSSPQTTRPCPVISLSSPPSTFPLTPFSLTDLLYVPPTGQARSYLRAFASAAPSFPRHPHSFLLTTSSLRSDATSSGRPYLMWQLASPPPLLAVFPHYP